MGSQYVASLENRKTSTTCLLTPLVKLNTLSSNNNNKKVLLRECKRHTTCHVVTTHSVVLSWPPWPPTGWTWPPQPPPSWTWPLPLAGPDPPGWTYPPGWTWPPCWLDLTPPGWTWPPHRLDLTPPPPLDLTPPVDRQIDGQTHVKTWPSRHTTYAGGNNSNNSSTINSKAELASSGWESNLEKEKWGYCDI